MKHLTKENVVLVLVSLLVLVQAKEMLSGPRKAPQRSREAVMERLRGTDRGDWGARMRQMRGSKEGATAPKRKAKEVSQSPKECCDSKKI